MNKVFWVTLSLSFSGTIMILILLLFTPWFRRFFSKKWQYYIWLIVLIRLIIPLTPKENLFKVISNGIWQDREVEQFKTDTDEYSELASNLQLQNPISNDKQTGNEPNQARSEEENRASTPNNTRKKNQENLSVHIQLMQYIWLIWISVACFSFLHKIRIYQKYMKSIKAGWHPIENLSLLDEYCGIKEKLGINRTIDLYVNPRITSPIMVGFFYPRIVLPNENINPTDFNYIMLHELTHYKRLDMYYKWLVQIIVCIHWFNPFIYKVCKEINRLCELSCDEAIIKKLDSKEKYDYGSMLLNAVQIKDEQKGKVVAVYLCDSKVLLKERLEEIVKYKKNSVSQYIASVFSIIAVSIGGVFCGAYTENDVVANRKDTTNTYHETEETYIKKKQIDYKVNYEINQLIIRVKDCNIQILESKDETIYCNTQELECDVQMNQEKNETSIQIQPTDHRNLTTDPLEIYHVYLPKNLKAKLVSVHSDYSGIEMAYMPNADLEMTSNSGSISFIEPTHWDHNISVDIKNGAGSATFLTADADSISIEKNNSAVSFPKEWKHWKKQKSCRINIKLYESSFSIATQK